MSTKLVEALSLASDAHAGQVRKGTAIPYLSHVIAVSALVLEHGGDEEQAIAGLLHDVIEDAGAQYRAVIADRFGSRVLRMVEDCTDADTIPKPPWRHRKELYLVHLRQCPADSLLVSACDKLHNARSIVEDLRDPIIGQTVFERFRAGREGTLWYYRALVDAFDAPIPSRLFNALSRAVDEMVLPA